MIVKIKSIKESSDKGLKTFVKNGFIKNGTRVLPDIDIDFPTEHIDEIKQYFIDKYGYDFFCRIGTYSEMQPKSALKDVARELGLDFKDINYFSSLINPKKKANFTWEDFWKQAASDFKLKDFISKNPKLLEQTELILGQFKSSGIHASATIITPNIVDNKNVNVYDLFPVRKVDGLLISEWEGGEMDEGGFLKEDILALADLDKIKMCLDLIKENLGIKIDIFSLPTDNAKVFEFFSKGYNEDVFQFNTPIFKQYCRQLKPDNIEDLFSANALIRPGTTGVGAHIDYVRIKHGSKEPEYDKFLEDITFKTNSLLIYQEQIMSAFKKIANATLAEAEIFRKFITKMKGNYEKDSRYLSYKDKFINGYKSLGVDSNYAEYVWKKLIAFTGYGFNRCISGKEKIMFKYKEGSTFEEGETVDIHTLFSCYSPDEYNETYSLTEDGEIVSNKINSIRYVGNKPVFKITLKNNAEIKVTLNHKFPTQNGIKMLGELSPLTDYLYHYDKVNDYVHLVGIKNIEEYDTEMVYDVTMEAPYHNYTTDQGIITCNSHAVSYSLLSYVDQYLKVEYPIYFWLAALSHTRKDEAIPKKLIEINQTLGDIVKLPDINISTDKFEGNFEQGKEAIYWALNKITGIGPAKLDKIMTERNDYGQFFSFSDFYSRINMSLKDLINLVLCGCFDSLHNIQSPIERRKLIQEACRFKGEETPSEYILGDSLKPFWWQLKAQELCGFSYIDYNGILPKELNKIWLKPLDLETGIGVKTLRCHAGIILSLKERSDKNGNYFASLEINQNNFISHLTIWSDMWEPNRHLIAKGKLLIYTGIVKYDNFKDAYTIQTCMDSKLIIK